MSAFASSPMFCLAAYSSDLVVSFAGWSALFGVFRVNRFSPTLAFVGLLPFQWAKAPEVFSPVALCAL
jgi:hypothetical protein